MSTVHERRAEARRKFLQRIYEGRQSPLTREVLAEDRVAVMAAEGTYPFDPMRDIMIVQREDGHHTLGYFMLGHHDLRWVTRALIWQEGVIPYEVKHVWLKEEPTDENIDPCAWDDVETVEAKEGEPGAFAATVCADFKRRSDAGES